MKTILVPTDFSEEAGYAYDFAYQLAKKINAVITLINVIEYPTGSSFNSMGIASDHDPMENIHIMKLMEATKNKMEDLIASKNFTDIKANFKIAMGNPYYQIADELKQNAAHMIIMGSRGAAGTKKAIVGSNAEKVIRNSRVPVITLHTPTRVDSINDIIFASDFEDYNTELTDHLTTLQSYFDAKLHLLKVNTPGYFSPSRQDQRKMELYVKQNELSNTTLNIYNDENEEMGIRHFALDIDADMIALSTHGRSGFGHFIFGSVAEDVANLTTKPVWTCKAS